jgi:genome maintenance exonuclease 1
MFIPKFNYQALERHNIDGVRKYATPDGENLPSVTTILDATKTEESKQALLRWRLGVGHKKAQEITTEAASRGTRMHKYLEDYIKTGELKAPGSNPYSAQSNRMASEIIKCGFANVSEVWGNEVPLYFPKLYAGTTDCVGVHDNDPSIIDFKQTNKPKKREWIDDYFVQLAFYATAHNEIHGTHIQKGVIFMCSADYQYQEFIVEGSDWQKYVQLMWQKLEEYYMKTS